MTMFKEEYYIYLSNYPKQILKGEKPFHHRFWIRYIQKLKPKGKLLDLGCGEGFFLEHAEKYYETYGVDISEYAISSAKQRCKRSKLYVKDAETRFDICQFDIIVCFDVLEHIEDPFLVMQECYRILRHKGLFIVSVPNTKSLGKFWKRENWHGKRDPTHVSLLPKEKWVKLLQDAGFQVLEIFFDYLWDSPYFRKIPAFLQHFLFKFPSTLFFFLGIRFPEKLGENVYIISIKNRE